MGLLGILLALGLLIWLAYRGWSVLLLAPAAALLAAAVAREPLLAHWTQTFMGSAAQFLAQFFARQHGCWRQRLGVALRTPHFDTPYPAIAPLRNAKKVDEDARRRSFCRCRYDSISCGDEHCACRSVKGPKLTLLAPGTSYASGRRSH
jgi:hypothetical protein